MYKDMTVQAFVDEVASKSPAPGGGSVSALGGALAAALANMVCNITIGRKKYADVQEVMADHGSSIEPLRAKLMDDIDRDTEAFNKVMAAYGMPKATDEEKSQRRQAIQDTMKEAALVPMEVAETTYGIMLRLEEIAAKGNQNAITDALVATMLARTAVLGALYNVEINLMSIKDTDFVTKLGDEVATLRREVMELESKIMDANKLQ